jgi:hypothetical protein
MSESMLLALVLSMVVLGGVLIGGSIFLVIKKLVEEKYGIALILIGMVFVLSPIYSVKKIGSDGIELEMGGVISYFKGAEKKPPPNLNLIEAQSAADMMKLSPAEKTILVAYRPNRMEDSEILIKLLKAADFQVTPVAEPLTGDRINIQYPPGITRIVYKQREQEAIVDRIFKVIQYYKSDPKAEIAIGGPYGYIRSPLQILLY